MSYAAATMERVFESRRRELECWIFEQDTILTIPILQSKLGTLSLPEAQAILHQCCTVWQDKVKAWHLIYATAPKPLIRLSDGTIQMQCDDSAHPHAYEHTMTWKLATQDQFPQGAKSSIYCIHAISKDLSYKQLSIHFDAIFSKPYESSIPILDTTPSTDIDDSILKAFEDEEDAPLSRSKRPCLALQDLEDDEPNAHEARDDMEPQLPSVVANGIYSKERTLDGMLSSSSATSQVMVPKQSWVNGYLVTEMLLQDASKPEPPKENQISRNKPPIESNAKKASNPKQGSLLQFFKK